MIQKIIFIFSAIFVAIYIIASILTSGTNVLSESMTYLAIIGVIISLLSPRHGMIFIFVMGNYLDLLKRLLVVGGNYGWIDVIRTLAVAPVAVTAVFCGVILHQITTKTNTWPWRRLILAASLFLAVSASYYLSGDTIQNTAQAIANSAIYILFIGFAAFIYKGPENHHRLFRLLTIIYIPVAIYAWFQLYFGYNSIEVDYARSGFTISIQPLMDFTLVESKRVFSTMNSSNAYTLVGSILGIYALIFGIGKGNLGRILGVIFAIFCLSSHIPGAGRTGWFVVIATYFLYFIFRNGKLTIATYILSICIISFFIFNADSIAIWLNQRSQELSVDSEFAQRAGNMGTFSTRTIGINEWMTNPKLFSWFGLSKDEIVLAGTHDMIGQIYVSNGIVGLAIGLLGSLMTLFYLHSNLLRIQNDQDQRLASFYLANVFTLLFSGVISGSSLHIFPVNIYFWLMIGLLFEIIDRSRSERNTTHSPRSDSVVTTRNTSPIVTGAAGNHHTA